MTNLNAEEIGQVGGGLPEIKAFMEGIRTADIIGAYEHLIEAVSYIFERIDNAW